MPYTIQELRKALIHSFYNIGRRRSDFLEGNELPRPLFFMYRSREERR